MGVEPRHPLKEAGLEQGASAEVTRAVLEGNRELGVGAFLYLTLLRGST